MVSAQTYSLATVSDQSPDCQRKRSTFGPSCSCHSPAQHWHAVLGCTADGPSVEGRVQLRARTPPCSRVFGHSLSYDSKRARLPCACSKETAFESIETNSSAPSHSPSWAITPSAQSPPASSADKPASTAVQFITTLGLLMRRRIASETSVADFL